MKSQLLDLPEIPEFKQKPGELKSDNKAKSASESVTEEKKKSGSLSKSLKDIPFLDIPKDSKKKSKKDGVASPLYLPRKDPKKKGLLLEEKKTKSEEKMKKSKSKPLRKKYGAISKNHKILSIIQEEIKPLIAYMPEGTVHPSPYTRNMIMSDERSMIQYYNKVATSIGDIKERKLYLIRMKRYNQIVRKQIANRKFTSRKRINWTALDKTKDICLLLNERKTDQKALNHIERQFNTLLRNTPKEDCLNILDTSIKYFEGEIKQATEDEFAQNVKDMQMKSETNSVMDSVDSDSNTQSMASISEDKYSSVNGTSDKNSGSMSSGKRSLRRGTIVMPEVTPLSGVSESRPMSMRSEKGRVKEKSKKLSKSKFGSFGDGISSSKRMFGDSGNVNPNSIKRMNRYNHEVGAYGFLKGSNTNTLVSALTSAGARNDNMLEVYERLKFFANE